MTPDEFKADFPEFNGEGNPTIQRWLDRSDSYFDVGRWGDLYSDGLGYWVAHQITLERRRKEGLSVVGGDETTKKVGTEMVQRDATTVNARMADPYLVTEYGREYAWRRDQVGMGAVATGAPFGSGGFCP